MGAGSNFRERRFLKGREKRNKGQVIVFGWILSASKYSRPAPP